MSHTSSSKKDEHVVTPPSTPPTPNVDPLSDIFDDSPPPSTASVSHAQHPSDIPRLRAEHSTAGYRDGITAAKEKFLQPGFDEGYSLGATFGLRVGCLLGKLEGLCLAKPAAARNAIESARLAKSLTIMRQELALENLFGREWWGEDGLWKYEIQTKDHPSQDDTEMTFKDIIESHPLVKKWDAIVEQEMEKAGVKRGSYDGPEWEAGRVHE